MTQETAGEREALDKLRGAMRFVLAFYEPCQTHLDTNAWKNAEASARAALKVADAAIAAKAQAPAAGFDRTTALLLLSAASKSGNEGAIRFAAQLAGATQCHGCGYVNFHCRCAAPKAPAENTSATPRVQADWPEKFHGAEGHGDNWNVVFRRGWNAAIDACEKALASEAGKAPAQPDKIFMSDVRMVDLSEPDPKDGP